MSRNEDNLINDYLKFLGQKVRDRVTGWEGVVSSISFDLYGCVQAVITPKVAKDGKIPEGRWFDIKRLVVLSSKSVMPVPSFAQVGGPENKPTISSDPTRS
jgi:hypothetical protein